MSGTPDNGQGVVGAGGGGLPAGAVAPVGPAGRDPVAARWGAAWRGLGVATAVLLVAFAVLFPEVVFRGYGLVAVDGALTSLPWRLDKRQNYLLADQAKTFLPAREFQYREARAGRFPLWNPYLACGVPFAAAIQHAVYFPPHLAYLWLSPFHAAGLVALAKLLLAGLLMRLYLRGLGLGEGAAVFGGVTYAYSGFMVTWLGHPHTSVAVFLPGILYAIDREVRLAPGWGPARRRNLVLLAVLGAGAVLGGHPPTTVHVALLACLYAGVRVLGRVRREAPGPAGREYVVQVGLAGGLVALAVVLLTAVQVLPYLEYHALSSTGASSARLVRGACHLSPGAIVNLFLPTAAGSPVVGHEGLRAVFGLAPADYHLDRAAQVGMAAWFLAVVAVWLGHRDPTVRFHTLAVVVCGTVVYGLPPWPWLLARLPLLGQVNHVRLTLVVDMGVAALAALGVQRLRDAPEQAAEAWRAVAAAVGLLAAGGIGLWLAGALRPEALAQAPPADRAFLAGELGCWGLLATLAGVWVCGRRWLRAEVWTAGLTVLAAVELTNWARGYNPALPRELYWPSTPGIQALQGAPDGEPYRVLGLGYVLPPNSALPYGLQDVRGVDYMTVRRYEELVSGEAGDFWFWSLARTVPAAVRLLNVRYFATSRERPPQPAALFETVYDGEIRVSRFLASTPRALLVKRWEVVGAAEALRRLREPSFDPADRVLLEASPAVAASEGGGAGDGASATAAVRVIGYAPDTVELGGWSPEPCLLLVLDTWYPGWEAEVNGRPAPLYRADYTFRAVPVPAGEFRVSLRYRPRSFRVGWLLSLSGVVLVVAAAGWPGAAGRGITPPHRPV